MICHVSLTCFTDSTILLHWNDYYISFFVAVACWMEYTRSHKSYKYYQKLFLNSHLFLFQLCFCSPKSFRHCVNVMSKDIPVRYTGFNCDILLHTIATARHPIILQGNILGYLWNLVSYVQILTQVRRKANYMQNGNYGKTHYKEVNYSTLGYVA